MTQYTEFSAKQIDAAYVNALVDLVNACLIWEVELDKVEHFQNGWRVTFKGFKDDAICHDGSYGSPNYMPHFYPENTNKNDWNKTGEWETMGFPWDNDDVSVHNAETVAYYIHCLTYGYTPWEEEEE